MTFTFKNRQKEMVDENLRLGSEVTDANRELAHVNKRLQQMLDAQREQISQDETRLVVAREVLESIPAPVIGIDNDGLIAFVNPDAERLISPAALLIGQSVEDVLDPRLVLVWRTESGAAQTMEVGGGMYRVVCRAVSGDQHARGKLLVLFPQSDAPFHPSEPLP